MTYPERSFCALFASLLLLSGGILAQPPKGFSRGFGISPARLSVSLLPGRQITTEFTLWNAGNRGTSRYTITVFNLGQTESGTVMSVPKGQGTRSCADWIEAPGEVEIPAGESRKVKVSVRCPPGVVGAYYAVLNIALASSKRDEGIVVAVQPTLGMTLEVTIPRPAASHLETKDLLYEPGSRGSSPAVVMNVQNTGVWKKGIEGDLLIHDHSGMFPVRIPIPYNTNGKPYEILPGMKVSLCCPLPRQLAPGKHQVSIRLFLTQKAQARQKFELEVPEHISEKTAIAAIAREKAELDIDLAVEPNMIEVVIPPGGRRTLPVKVRNNDTRTAHIRMQVTQARMESNGMITYLESINSGGNEWLTVSPEAFDLDPNRSITLRVQAINPKEDPEQMPLFGVIRLQANAAATEYHDDWASEGEFPVLIVAQAPKAPPASLKTMEFRLVRRTPEQNPSAAILRVKNTGGQVARAYGVITVEQTDGREIARMDIGSSEAELIFPESEREFRMAMPVLDKGKFRVRAELSPGNEGGNVARAEEVFTAKVGVPEGLRQ